MFKFILLALLTLFIFTTAVEAKLLPQAKKGSATVTVKSSSGGGIGIYPKLRGDRRALLVNYSNLQNSSNVSYLLTYESNGQQEGAMGALVLNGSSNQSSELLFGTCSKNVCRYHTGIKNAKLEVSYTLKNGKKYLKKYRIKV